MRSLINKVVLITGGAQGLGLNAAGEFAEEGSILILTDINKDSLAEAKSILEAKGAEVHTYTVDVTVKKKVDELADKVLKKFGKVDVMINNAGIGHHADLEETSLDTWRKLMDVNFWGPLYHIYAFLPSMKERGEGHIVNISSGQAFLRMPTWGAYSAIKLAIGAVSELLHFELEQYNIRVTTVYPYMINTGFYNDIEYATFVGKLSKVFLPLYSQKPSTVGRIIFDAVKNEKKVEMVSPINTIMKYLHFFPLSSNVTNRMITSVLSEGNKEAKPKSRISQLFESAFNTVEQLVDRTTGGVGFSIDELMIGDHEFTEGSGPEGRLPFHFRVNWGVDSLAKWSNPFEESFLINDLEGTISIGGMKEDIPCKGKLELKYFDEQKIRYTFDFKIGAKAYEYVGEKRQIYPWNLPYSHTTCFGVVKEKKSGKVISNSITHFQLEDLPEFVKSLKLKRA